MSAPTIVVVVGLGVLLGLGWFHVSETVRLRGERFRRPISWLVEIPCMVRNGGHVWRRFHIPGGSFISCAECNAEPARWRRQAPRLTPHGAERPRWRRAVQPVAVVALLALSLALMGCQPVEVDTSVRTGLVCVLAPQGYPDSDGRVWNAQACASAARVDLTQGQPWVPRGQR